MEVLLWSAFAVLAAVLVLIEWRIMRKPASERSEREKRFMVVDRAAAKRFNSFGQKVAPVMMMLLGLLLVLLAVYSRGTEGPAVLLTVIGVASALGGAALLYFVSKYRGQKWQDAQDAENRRADIEGRPRWVASPRGGMLFGSALVIVGVVMSVFLQEDEGAVRVPGLVVIAGGGIFVFLSVWQIVQDRRRT